MLTELNPGMLQKRSQEGEYRRRLDALAAENGLESSPPETAHLPLSYRPAQNDFLAAGLGTEGIGLGLDYEQ
jgi:hypothetical protein